MLKSFLAFVLLAALTLGTGLAQESPSPSSSPAASPSPSASPPKMVELHFPKGWARCPGDGDAITVCSPTMIPDVRIVKMGVMDGYTTDKGVAMMKDVAGRFPGTEVTTGTVCNGAQPAVFATSKNANGTIDKKMALVMGHVSGAIITFENPTGAAVDPGIDTMFNTLCWP